MIGRRFLSVSSSRDAGLGSSLSLPMTVTWNYEVLTYQEEIPRFGMTISIFKGGESRAGNARPALT